LSTKGFGRRSGSTNIYAKQRVWLALIGACTIIVVVAVFAIYSFVSHRPVRCPDGTSRPRIDAASFQTQYSGYSAKLSARFGAGKELAGEITPKQLLAMSEAIQFARLHLQALAEGYNACAVSVAEFNDSRDRFSAMEDIARQMDAIFANGARSPGARAQLSGLVDRFLELAGHSGSAGR